MTILVVPVFYALIDAAAGACLSAITGVFARPRGAGAVGAGLEGLGGSSTAQ